jgi:hypothetical protein
LQKGHMLCCASSFVVAAYDTVRLIPQDSRALPLALFTSSSEIIKKMEETVWRVRN